MTPAATATPNSLTGMVAVSKGSKVKPLGYIVWFSVPDKPVNVKVLRKHWTMAALDTTILPKDPRSLYLFKRAVRSQEGRIKHDDGTYTQTDVVDVLESPEHCVYQISRVVRDVDKREVDYPKAMRVVYDKRTEEVAFNKLGDSKPRDLIPMQDAIMDFLEQNTKMIDGRKVRTVVRDFLHNEYDEGGGRVGLSGENLRGKAGGVYFVAARFQEELDGLAQALAGLYEEEGGIYGLYSVPLADGKSEREMIRAHHVANTMKELQEAVKDVAKLLRDGRKAAVRSNVAAHHWRRLQALRRRVAEYQALLHEEDEDIEDLMEMASKQLEKLPSA